MSDTASDTLFDSDRQDAYAKLRALGAFDNNPDAHDAAAKLVKLGVLRDLSGGSPAPAPPAADASAAFAGGTDTPDPADHTATALAVKSTGSRYQSSYMPSTPRATASAPSPRVAPVATPAPSTAGLTPGQAEAVRQLKRTLTPQEMGSARMLTPAQVRARLGAPVAPAGSTGTIAPTPNRSLAFGGARTGVPLGDLVDTLHKQIVLAQQGYAPNMNAAQRYAEPLGADIQTSLNQISGAPINFTQGALTPGLRRMGDDPSGANAFNGLSDIFSDIPGNIASGVESLRNDTGAGQIGHLVPELDPNTLAGTLYNLGTRAGTDPLNFVFAPDKAVTTPVALVRLMEKVGMVPEGAAALAKAKAVFNTETAGPSIADKIVRAAKVAGPIVRDKLSTAAGKEPLFDRNGKLIGYAPSPVKSARTITRPVRTTGDGTPTPAPVGTGDAVATTAEAAAAPSMKRGRAIPPLVLPSAPPATTPPAVPAAPGASPYDMEAHPANTTPTTEPTPGQASSPTKTEAQKATPAPAETLPPTSHVIKEHGAEALDAAKTASDDTKSTVSTVNTVSPAAPAALSEVKNATELAAALQKHFGYDEQTAKASATLFDIRAQTHAHYTGETPDDYYRQHLAGIGSGSGKTTGQAGEAGIIPAEGTANVRANARRENTPSPRGQAAAQADAGGDAPGRNESPDGTPATSGQSEPGHDATGLRNSSEPARAESVADLPPVPAAGAVPAGRIEYLNPTKVKVLPGMQYKRAGLVDEKAGVTGLLKNQRTYDTEQGGTWTVYRDENGQDHVVNGHHRLELAQRAERFTRQEIQDGRPVSVDASRQVPAVVLDAKEGWTPELARTRGALENLRDGKGTAIDAADALHGLNDPETIAAEVRGLPQTSLSRDTAGLVRLDDAARAQVRNGEVKESAAAAIGATLGHDPERVRVAMEQARLNHIRSYDEAAHLASVVRDELIVRKAAAGQLGFEGFDDSAAEYQSTAGTQAKIRAALEARLGKEKSSLLAVEKTQARAGESFDVTGRRQEAAQVEQARGKAAMLLDYEPDVKAALRQAAADHLNGKISQDEAVTRVRETVLASAHRTPAEVMKRAGQGAEGMPEDQAGGLFEHGNVSGQESTLFQGARASIEFLEDGRAIIRALSNPDASSFPHEIGHLFRRDLYRSVGRNGFTPADLGHLNDWAGTKDGNWDTKAEEKFARAFEGFIKGGKAPTPLLQRVFDYFKSILQRIYAAAKRDPTSIPISDPVRDIFERMLGRDVPEGVLKDPFAAEGEAAEKAGVQLGHGNSDSGTDRISQAQGEGSSRGDSGPGQAVSDATRRAEDIVPISPSGASGGSEPPSARTTTASLTNEHGGPVGVNTAEVSDTPPTGPEAFGMKMEDVKAAAEKLGISVPDKAAFKESFADVKRRADAEFESLRKLVQEADPRQAGALSPEEYYVGHIRLRQLTEDEVPDILRSLEKEDLPEDEKAALNGKLTNALAEADDLAGKLYKAGSDAGRRLAFQKAALSGPFDGASILKKAQAAAGGTLSTEAKTTLIRQVEKVKLVKKTIDANVEARAAAAEKRLVAAGGGRLTGEVPRPSRPSREDLITRIRGTFAAGGPERLNQEAVPVKTPEDTSTLFQSAVPEDTRDALVQLGVHHVESGTKRLDRWMRTMRADIGSVASSQIPDAELQGIYANARVEAALNAEDVRLAKGNAARQNFAANSVVENLAGKIGMDGAAEFFNRIAESDKAAPDLLPRFVSGGFNALSPDEQTVITDIYNGVRDDRASALTGSGSRAKDNGPVADLVSMAATARRTATAAAKAARSPRTATPSTQRNPAIRTPRPAGQPKPKPAATPPTAAELLARSIRGRYGKQGGDGFLKALGQGLVQRLADGATPTEVEADLIRRAEKTFRRGIAPQTQAAIRRASAVKSLNEALSAGHAEARRQKSLSEAPARASAAAEKDAEKRLDVMSQAFPKKGAPTGPNRADLVAVGVREYAKGARSLEAFAKKLKASDAGKYVDEATLQGIFTDAAIQYRKDYSQIDEIKAQMAAVVAKEAKKNLPLFARVYGAAVNVVNAGRTLKTSFDLSAPFRQGAFLSLANPRLAAQIFPDMVKSFAREDVAHAVDAAIRTRPNAPDYERGKLHLSEMENASDLSAHEEMFRSNLAEKLPLGVGKVVGASERAYTTYLNKLRADSFDALSQTITGGSRPLTDAEAEAIANFINVASGRGTGRVADAAAKLFNGVMFAPRFAVSRFQLGLGAPFISAARKAPTAARVIAKTYLQYAGSVALILGLATLAAKLGSDNVDMESDPRSSNFGKVRIGNLLIDIHGGLNQVMVFVAHLLANQTKTQQGQIKPAAGLDTIAHFARGKLSPAAGSVADFSLRSPQHPYGKDFIGQDIGQTGGEATALLGDRVPRGGARALDYYATQNLLPMTFSDLTESAKAENIPTSVAAGLFSVFGFGVRSLTSQEARMMHASISHRSGSGGSGSGNAGGVRTTPVRTSPVRTTPVKTTPARTTPVSTALGRMAAQHSGR